MENFIFTLNIILPIFLFIVIGYLLRTFKVVDKKFFENASPFLFKVILPIQLFKNIYYTGGLANVDFKYVLFCIVLTLIIVLIAFFTVPLFEKQKGRAGATIQALFRSNFLILGLPLAIRAFGEQAAGEVGIMMSIVIPLYNIVAVIVLSIYTDKEHKEELKSKHIILGIIKNPLIIACIIALFSATINLKLPSMMNSFISELAGIAVPLALIIMGGQIKIQKLKANLKPVVIVSFLKLIVIPVFVILTAVLAGYRNIQLFGIMTIFATPVAVTSFIMADNMDCDGEIAAQYVVGTTAVSVFTLFLFIYFLKSFALI